MNVQEYIASGILESYVLGGLDSKEIQEVEYMAAKYPEIKSAIEVHQSTFFAFVDTIQVNPKASVKKRLMETIEKEGEAEKKTGSSLVYFKFAAAASFVLMVVAGSLATYYWSKWQNAEGRLVALENQTNQVASDIQKANFKIKELASYYDAIKDTAVVKVTMKGVPQYATSSAVVFWNRTTKQVLIDGGNLPTAPEGKQYQLWALKDGVPIDAGVIEGNGLQKVKSIELAEAYAVTLEPKGGSSVPTLSAMFVFGKI